MFTISAKSAYGIYAILELAKHYQVGSIQIKDIADSQNIPQHYLEQLLVLLRKAGLVNSFRGTNGGYQLAKHPSQIKVYEIFTVLEGRVKVLRDQVPRGGLDFYWGRLESELEKMISCTVEDLLMEKQEIDSSFIYNI